jgi:hypothetical protein
MRTAWLATSALLICPLVARGQDTTAAGLPRGWGAPEWTTQERTQRVAALNAVLAFRPDLRGDSTRVAACTLEAQVQDTAAARWVLPAARHLLIQPLAPDVSPRFRCSVMAFSKPGVRVLYLETLREVRRRGFPGGAGSALGAAAGLSFEADFQWLDGPGYRRFEHYEVRPRSPDGKEWRVVRYEFAGEQFIDSFGSAGRRP